MRGNLFIITNAKLPKIIFPKDDDNYILTYRLVNEGEIKRQIKFSTCRTFIDKKEILNLFNINGYAQVVKANEVKIKPFDKILVLLDNQYLILEMLEVKHYFKVLKKIKKL